MAEICKKCGLLKDLCVCEILDKEETKRIRVYVERMKFKKFVTVIEGLDKQRIKEALSDMKKLLACGGTIKDGAIVLQGNHKRLIEQSLIKMGYPKEVIEVQ
ncbi:MAG: stress response translation initiation inhibitor YciH [Candidatus ainarchaeum sp.]|nr:stress response translation initiation inhibitor YciH [Candidatus ainarchaeum sp.]